MAITSASFLYILAIALLFFSIAGRQCSASSKQRTHPNRLKRHVIFPIGGGIFKLIVGLGIPTKLGIRQSMALGMNFQFQYKVPMDIAELEKPYPPIVAKSRERRAAMMPTTNFTSDRTLFYMGLEAAMNRNGLNGRQCMLHTICDNAMHTLQHDSNGLFGELMHIALTPSLSYRHDVNAKSPPQSSPSSSSPSSSSAAATIPNEEVYLEAQRAGEFGVDCSSLYPECPAGANLLDMLSVLDN